MINQFVGSKKQMKVKSIVDKGMRIIMLPVTLPLFLLRWIAYNIEEIMFGLDKYIYEPFISKISIWLAKKF